MRVPEIDNINDELGRDFFEQIVAVMVLINVAFDIGGLLENQVVFTGRRLGPVDLSLVDELTTWGGLRDLNSLGVVDAHVPFGLPLNVILVERIEVTRRVVKKHAVWCQTTEHLRRFILRDRLQKTSFLVAIYDVELLFADSTEMDE